MRAWRHAAGGRGHAGRRGHGARHHEVRPAACVARTCTHPRAAPRRLVWFPAAPPGASGCSVGFERIVMHAISRDSATGARPCIFAQVERPPAPGAMPGDDEDGGDEEDEEELLSCTELRLVPSDEAARALPLQLLCADGPALTPRVRPV